MDFKGNFLLDVLQKNLNEESSFVFKHTIKEKIKNFRKENLKYSATMESLFEESLCEETFTRGTPYRITPSKETPYFRNPEKVASPNSTLVRGVPYRVTPSKETPYSKIPVRETPANATFERGTPFTESSVIAVPFSGVSLLIIISVVYLINKIFSNDFFKFVKNLFPSSGLMLLKEDLIKIDRNFSDIDVILVISSTYDTLYNLRNERERQSKKSFNIALILTIVGVLIVFCGVFLLFQKNIMEGVLCSSVGSVSSIIGGTIIKLYKDSNERMDKLDDDLFTLKTAEAQYAVIREISNETERNVALAKLANSLGKITKHSKTDFTFLDRK